jgi:hypothetical protein
MYTLAEGDDDERERRCCWVDPMWNWELGIEVRLRK